MTDRTEEKIITKLAHDVAIKVAPQERRVFGAISEAYFKNPEKTLKGEGGGDELIGFGVGEIALLTPIILEVASVVVKSIIEDAAKDFIKKKSSSIFKRLINFIKQFLKDEPPTQVLAMPHLTKGQLVQVRQLAFEKAILLKLDSDQASLLADSLVVSLEVSG